MSIKKGTILVANETQYFNCGATKLHMGAIVKAARDQIDETDELLKVFLSKKREEVNNYVIIRTDSNKVRLATEEEIKKWEAGIRNCKGELV